MMLDRRGLFGPGKFYGSGLLMPVWVYTNTRQAVARAATRRWAPIPTRRTLPVRQEEWG